jgi:hypothetical protein
VYEIKSTSTAHLALTKNLNMVEAQNAKEQIKVKKKIIYT